jgi:hypothetical protein
MHVHPHTHALENQRQVLYLTFMTILQRLKSSPRPVLVLVLVLLPNNKQHWQQIAKLDLTN